MLLGRSCWLMVECLFICNKMFRAGRRRMIPKKEKQNKNMETGYSAGGAGISQFAFVDRVDKEAVPARSLLQRLKRLTTLGFSH